VYNSCPFRFYCKVSDQEQDGDTDVSYGDAGTVVHKVLEYYFTHLIDTEFTLALNELKNHFNNLWEQANIQNVAIDKDEYWLSVINSLKLNLHPTHLEYEFKLSVPFEFIGYADVMNTDEHWIGDWKTSTYKAKKLETYKDQLRFYAYAYYREHNVVPMTWVFFAKSNKIFKFKFPLENVLAVETELKKIALEIEERFKQMKFERNASNTNCYFCPYKKVCSTDLLRQDFSEQYEVKFYYKKNKLLVEANIPEIIHRKIEKEANFELKNAFFIIQAMRAKGVAYDAIKRLYKRKDFGGESHIGFAETIHKILKDYALSKGMRLKLTIIDSRETTIMNSNNTSTYPNKLDIPFELYKFQTEAVDELISHRWGICEVGTGGGKTAIAAECIRRLNTKTLFIIDNKDLLMQTKDEYEKMLNTECGIVGMGYRDWSKPITLATIQTIEKHSKEFANELAKINLVIYDETHIIATKSFETVSKFLVNTKYRFGFSATAKRDDGADNIIFAHTGPVVFKKKAGALIEEGLLVNPEAIFHDYDNKLMVSDTWQNEYNDGIVDNDHRNKKILEIVEHYRAQQKQIMILCKMVRHCEFFHGSITGSQLIYGRTDDEVRYETLEDFKDGKIDVLIGNLKIFNKGINLKNLDVLINASGNAGDVVTVQTIGRILRKNPGKLTAHYIDFIDAGEYLKKHSFSRIQALKNEDYNVKIVKG
jgi:superfamily II DNA or RNA helicase/CRISPR/Cas system-associated exonuclease Cas4 (RecB family)